ncbi:MAG TPA: CPBP family intramembrane glutamic endopeptidase [Ktedonobacterales bacterium]|nr:CPBP family intramembrane glutamic endopeptidase [Ktedonobacterales bacterium]
MLTYENPRAVGEPMSRRGVGSWLRRHPLTGYFALAFLGTWLTLTPVVLSKNGIGLLPYETPTLVFVVLFISSALLGPTLAGFVMTALQTGKPGVRQLFRRYVQWRVAPQWYFLVFLGYIVLYLAASAIVLGMAPVAGIGAKWVMLLTAYLPAVLTFNLVTALGEEPGWRGYALPRLQLKYGPVRGSLILGTLHALWHLPVFFLPMLGFGHFTVSFFLTWIPAVWATTILWTWIFNNTRGSLLIAILLHSASDAAGTFVLATLLGVTKLALPIQNQVGITFVVLLVSIALAVMLLTRGRLSYRRERTERIITPAAIEQELREVA